MNSNFKLKIKNYLTWLQALPEEKKKVVLWTIVVVLAIIMGIFWVKGAVNNLSKIGEQTKNINFPKVEIPQMPSLDILQTTTPTDK